MQCPRCQHENPQQAKFCLECGVRLGSISRSRSPSESWANNPGSLPWSS